MWTMSVASDLVVNWKIAYSIWRSVDICMFRLQITRQSFQDNIHNFCSWVIALFDVFIHSKDTFFTFSRSWSSLHYGMTVEFLQGFLSVLLTCIAIVNKCWSTFTGDINQSTKCINRTPKKNISKIMPQFSINHKNQKRRFNNGNGSQMG